LRTLSLAALILAVGFMLTINVGCMKCGSDAAEKMVEKAMETAIEKGTGGKAKVDMGGNVDISDLPAFARYPGAQGKTRWSMSNDEGSGTVYGLESGDATDKVVDWYKKSLSGAGLKQVSIMESGDGTMMIYGSEDEKKMTTVTVSADKGKTSIVVMHGQDK